MGTRNLTIVKSDNEIKVAQYGQWDGYPEGQGATALSFLRSANLDAFREKLRGVKFLTREDVKAKWASVGADSSGFVSMDIANKFQNLWPELDRDMGAEVLQSVYDGMATELESSYTFAADSLFCEWCYVIDLDKNTFEVYEGFNKSPLTESDRFYHLQEQSKAREEKYYPVRLSKTFALDRLPSKEEFIAAFATEDEDA